MLSISQSEWYRLTEEAITNFDIRLQELRPAYQPGQEVELHGEGYEVFSYQKGGGMTGYWLRREQEEIFLPLDMEAALRPVI